MAGPRRLRAWQVGLLGAVILLLFRCPTESLLSWVWPSGFSRSMSRDRVRRQAEDSWFPNPFANIQGSMADPGYWKQQYFLAANLKQLLPPNRDEITAMQLAPNDCKYLGYLAPDKMPDKETGEGVKLEQYLVLGPVSGIQKYEFEKQCKVYSVAAGFREWQRDVLNLVPRKDVHVGVVSAGTAARLGGRILSEGLVQLAAALTRDGRVLLVCNEEDEKVIGGKLEDVMEAQNWKEMEESGDLPPDPEKDEMAQVLQQGKLRLVRVQRDECGLTIGVCAGTYKPKAVKKASAAKKAEAKTAGPRRGRSRDRGAASGVRR